MMLYNNNRYNNSLSENLNNSINQTSSNNLLDNNLSSNEKIYYHLKTYELINGKYLWCALYNQKNANTRIFIDKICVTNYCSNTIEVKQLLYPSISYDGFNFMHGIPNNSINREPSNGIVIKYHGNENLIKKEERCDIRVLQPLLSHTTKVNGNLILYPGESILMSINSQLRTLPSCTIEFIWWEC